MGFNSHENEISYQVTKDNVINRQRGRVKLAFSTTFSPRTSLKFMHFELFSTFFEKENQEKNSLDTISIVYFL